MNVIKLGNVASWQNITVKELTISNLIIKYKVFYRNAKERPVSVLSIFTAVLILLHHSTSHVNVHKGRRNFVPGKVIPRFRLASSRNASHSTLNGIQMPNIIHQIWKSYEIPELFHKWLPSVIEKNPEWEYWFWTDAEMRNMIQYHYPGFLDLYDSYPSIIYRADAFRYFVLHQYGGVYADLDIQFMQPIRNEIKFKRCVFSTEPETHAHFLTKVPNSLVSNALIACDSYHPFLSFILDNLIYHTGVIFWHNVLHATGPFMLTTVYEEYFRELPGIAKDERTSVYLADPEVFQPTIDESMVDRVREMCLNAGKKWHWFQSLEQREREMRVCGNMVSSKFHNGPTDRSVTDHHWSHTWGGRVNDPWGILNSNRMFNIKELNTGRQKARI